METYEIIPLHVGEFPAFEKSNLTHQTGFGKKIVVPIIMYLIKGKDKCVLVDTGGSDEEWAIKYHYPLLRTDGQHPIQALKKVGIAAEDIEFVVNTHLHWDHCFNNILFPKAKIYIQKMEIQYAICPLPQHQLAYESYHVGLTAPWLKSITQIQDVEGDVAILPGIELVALPGHSPGFQGVLINTENGKYLIAGDCLSLFENWDAEGNHNHILPGIHYSFSEFHQTFSKIEKICDHILPGHDIKVFDHPKYPFEISK